MNLDRLGKIVGSGLIIVAGPQILSGMLNEYVKTITVTQACEWIAHQVNAWDSINPEWQEKLKVWGPRLGDLKWLTVEYIVKECRESNPAVISLVINWPEAHQWLSSQLEDLKEKVLPSHAPLTT